MTPERASLGSLGQGWGPYGALLDTSSSLVSHQSGEREKVTSLDDPLHIQISARRKDIEPSSKTRALAARTSYFSPDVAQFGVLELRKTETIAFATKSAKTSLPRGRITGPVKFVKQLLTTWRLELPEACILLGFELSESDHVKDVLQGYATLRGRDANDRIAHLFQIRKLLSALFRDEAVENEWLRETRDALQGKAPMDLLLEGSMENLLLVKEYVEVVTGR